MVVGRPAGESQRTTERIRFNRRNYLTKGTWCVIVYT